METYQLDPWELKERHDKICKSDPGQIMERSASDVNDAEDDLVTIADIEQCETGWIVLQRTAVLMVNSDGERQGQLRIPDGYCARACACIPGVGILVRTTTDDVGYLTMLAHPDTIARAAVSEVRVAWMTSVFFACSR